jgi:hypothetical protein
MDLHLRSKLAVFCLVGLMTWPACKAEPVDDETPSPTSTTDTLLYRRTEEGQNLRIVARRDYDLNNAVTAESGNMSLRYHYIWITETESGIRTNDCTTDIDESGAFIGEVPEGLAWAWELNRTMIQDGCSIGLLPATLRYGWTPDEPDVLYSNRFGTWTPRYSLDPPITLESGATANGRYEEIDFSGEFLNTQGDLD